MVNFGVVKNRVSKNLSEHYVSFNNKKAEEEYREFITTVKGSPILMLEYIVFKNLEKNAVLKEAAYKYIDDNIYLFKNYEKKEIIAENNKLKKFLPESESADKLTDSIQTLILESASKNRIPNIDKMHRALELVMESMSTMPEPTCECEEEDTQFSLNEIIAVANKNLQEKVAELDEDEQKIISTMYSDDEKAQEAMLESYKTKAIEMLSKEAPNQMINEVYEKVNSMTYSKETALDNILALYELIH